MLETLKNRTTRSSIKLLKDSLRSLRRASSDMSIESNIEATLKEADVLSSVIKRLSGYFQDDVTPVDGPVRGEELDLPQINKVITAVVDGRICKCCGGVIPKPE